ncbi:MAG: hypothetical protein Alpg2KO_14750 [Alphaproteobacteria bacterium]
MQGEFWLEPMITDDGSLEYRLKFIDPAARNERITEVISLSDADAVLLRDGLQKLYGWAEKARERGVSRRYDKIAVCFPQSACGNRVVGNSSTQLDFLIYEDGALGARLIRNRGPHQTKWNMSVESASLLSAYFDFVLEAGSTELKQGSVTDEDLDDLFDE